jgi:hypothetical protein
MFRWSTRAGSRRLGVPASLPRDHKVISNREIETRAVRSAPRPQTIPIAEVRGHGFCRMTRTEAAGIRRHPEAQPRPCPSLQSSVVRHSDDQTIVALSAVYKAVSQMEGCRDGEFDGWGILVASRFLGRSTLIEALNRFLAEGVWGVSPHLIPHYALHSPAGTLSVALGLRGPNLGIGGGVGAGFEGLLAALSWLTSGVVPGLWLVQSAWSPEFVPDQQGEPMGNCACRALAMALVHSPLPSPGRFGLRLVTSRDRQAQRSLSIDEVGELLERRSAIPSPHFNSRARGRSTARAVACDAAGRTRIELVLPRPHHTREER